MVAPCTGKPPDNRPIVVWAYVPIKSFFPDSFCNMASSGLSRQDYRQTMTNAYFHQ